MKYSLVFVGHPPVFRLVGNAHLCIVNQMVNLIRMSLRVCRATFLGGNYEVF